jgi:hypothetical protein
MRGAEQGREEGFKLTYNLGIARTASNGVAHAAGDARPPPACGLAGGLGCSRMPHCNRGKSSRQLGRFVTPQLDAAVLTGRKPPNMYNMIAVMVTPP